MKVAHLSDIHWYALEELPLRRLLNKRITGYMNLILHRGKFHHNEIAKIVAQEIRKRNVDHVVITGDFTHLALEQEYVSVLDFIENTLGYPPHQVSLVPGNHDLYTKGSDRSKRFEKYFAKYLESDLQEEVGQETFPFVHLRGPVAFIGLNTAVPRLPFIASGSVGKEQLNNLGKILNHEKLCGKTVVLLQHHPMVLSSTLQHRLRKGLVDAVQESNILNHLRGGLLLHGHSHERVVRMHETSNGVIQMMGASSASLISQDINRMAGFNLYELDDLGSLVNIESFRFDTVMKPFTLTELLHKAP